MFLIAGDPLWLSIWDDNIDSSFSSSSYYFSTRGFLLLFLFCWEVPTSPLSASSWLRVFLDLGLRLLGRLLLSSSTLLVSTTIRFLRLFLFSGSYMLFRSSALLLLRMMPSVKPFFLGLGAAVISEGKAYQHFTRLGFELLLLWETSSASMR